MFNLETLLMICQQRGEDMLFPDWNSYKTFSPLNYTVTEDCFVLLVLNNGNNIFINDTLFVLVDDYAIVTLFLKKGDKLHIVRDAISAYIIPLVKSGGGVRVLLLDCLVVKHYCVRFFVEHRGGKA